MEADKIYGGFLYLRSKSDGVLRLNALCGEKKDEGRTAEIILNGDDEYRSFDFYSMGEIRVNVKNESEKPSEISVGFIFTHFPVSNEAKTVTNDNELNAVLDVCCHTLKICRQTHHLDSTTHCEPLACTGDYYIETLMTAFSFGDMRLAEFDIIRTAEMLRSNNGVMFHTSYSLIWVLMLYDTYLFTGNKKLLYACEDALIILLSRFEGYLGENGLIENPPNFMFVDWIYIDGLSLHHPPKALGQTCLNMFYYGALDTASKIFNELSEYGMAQECDLKKQTLKLSINSILFDKEKGLYFEGLNTETNRALIGKYMPENVKKRYYLKHSNILAAYFGICDNSVELIEKIMSDECKGEYQPYFAHYLLEAVYKNGLRDKYTLEILNMWKKPTLEFEKGLVEGFIKPEPSYSFDHSHAWGGTPLYSLPKALLGVEINKAGMSEITINPSLLGLKYAKAELPTPFGCVVCEMSKENNIQLTYPDEITVHLKNN